MSKPVQHLMKMELKDGDYKSDMESVTELVINGAVLPVAVRGLHYCNDTPGINVMWRELVSVSGKR